MGRLAGGGDSRHGQLAADWVEVFAPVVFAPHAPANDYFVRHDPDRVTRRLVRRLEALGHTVLLKGPEVAT